MKLLVLLFLVSLVLISGCVSQSKVVDSTDLGQRQLVSYTFSNFSGRVLEKFSFIEDGKLSSFARNDLLGQKTKMVYDISTKLDVPAINLNVNEIFLLAQERLVESNIYAKFDSIVYYIPKISELYFGVNSPALSLNFINGSNWYSLVYNLDTKEEVLFDDGVTENSALCQTIGLYIKYGECVPEFNRVDMESYTLVNSPYWSEAIDWIKTNVARESRILSWWDYYSTLWALGGRKVFPESNNNSNIVSAAKIFSSNRLISQPDLSGFDYILVDKTMISKYASIRLLAGTAPASITGFEYIGLRETNDTQILEYRNGDNVLYVTLNEIDGILDVSMRTSDFNGKINNVCGSDGVKEIDEDVINLFGCVSEETDEEVIYYIPGGLQDDVFVGLMFMGGIDMPLGKVFENKEIQIYKVGGPVTKTPAHSHAM